MTTFYCIILIPEQCYFSESVQTSVSLDPCPIGSHVLISPFPCNGIHFNIFCSVQFWPISVRYCADTQLYSIIQLYSIYGHFLIWDHCINTHAHQ